jgi:hypothetical protein
LLWRINQPPVDCEQHIASADRRTVPGGTEGDFAGGNLVSLADPQHAIVGLGPGPDGNVGCRETEERKDDGRLYCESRPNPDRAHPAGLESRLRTDIRHECSLPRQIAKGVPRRTTRNTW